ncbi:MAG: NAD(P)H-hydrate dehydratase [Verrucomicrobiota bacterium]
MNSPLVSSARMRAMEEEAFARGIEAEALMDRAGVGIAAAVRQFFPKSAHCVVYSGKGNNGGDALVAAEHLKRAGWDVDVRLAFPESELSELARKKLRSFQGGKGLSAPTVAALRPLPHSIILDGLLGLGAKPPLREPIRTACREINRLRREQGAFVFAVDLPTGLDGDSGETDPDCVIADCTITIGLAKKGLVADGATNYVGRLEIVPLADLHATGSDSDGIVATASSLHGLLPRREFDVHKNQFGRIGIVAGSKGFTGAALMCSLGALRGGAGLVEVFVPEEIYPIIAAAAAPEAMVKSITTYRSLLEEPVDVWAVGPGLGKSQAAEVLELIERAEKPMVVDADGLNILAGRPETLSRCAGPRLITPHPGEMKRLFPSNEISRAETVAKFCEKYPVTLLLKGSRTIVGERDRPQSFNTTGNPGMATGGMGDVLTGVCAALIGQGFSLYDAARVGAWVCGRAAEMAIFNGNASEESLLPRDLLDYVGAAFKDLR